MIHACRTLDVETAKNYSPKSPAPPRKSRARFKVGKPEAARRVCVLYCRVKENDPLDKPIAESNALFIRTALYPFPGGPGMAWRAICGEASSPLCELGWKSLGVLDLTALPSIGATTLRSEAV
jgi:hypothetical protein